MFLVATGRYNDVAESVFADYGLEIKARESIHRPILQRINIENSQPQASVVSMDMSRTHATPCSLRPPRRPGDSTNISGSELELDPTLVR